MIGPKDLLPSVNAVLNGTSAVLLSLGYVAVQRRRIGVHKVCMLAALVVSAVFLASYLWYHFGVQDPELTSFKKRASGAPEWVAYLYYGILLTHVVLAVVVAPLAPITAYLGLKDRLPRHRRLARWTWPIWMYVSVTGVVVYWMLYRLYPSP